jgi:RNA polymerase sigma-70 factor (ECF subfamily)
MTVSEYNQAVDLYSDGIYRFLLKNTRDEDKAKDLVQDTFEKLWVKIDTVAGDKVKSYLYTTAYHSFIDGIRRDSRIDELDNVKPEQYQHSEQYSDLQEILHEAIGRLPETQRSVILLRDYEGYSYEEIAEITGLSESQVKVYIFRGRTFLKSYIGNLESVLG